MQADPRPVAAILRYVYPGVTPKNGRVVVVEGDGGCFEMRGGEIVERLVGDGVDAARWDVRYYNKTHEGWMKLPPEEMFAFSDDRRMLELMLEPAPEPRDALEDEDDRRRRESLRSERSRDGYFGVGVVGGKNEHNNGTLWRSAWQLGCAFTFTVGARFAKTSADTTKTWTSLPAYDYEDFNAFAAASPRGAPWVAVEMGGTPLADFTHPDRAVYILGSEDNGLPSSVLRACAHHVSLPVASPDRTSSFNVAVTGALVLHDRLQKRRLGNEVAAVREGDALRGGRAGVDSAKPSQVIEANKNKNA
jgi:tRNA(Leu) C34 or U34 (ribose-2'-O)-methylase TrmL